MVAPRSPAPLWRGSEPSGGGPTATDYDRACNVEDGAALLPAGSGWVVILNSELAGAGWLRLGDEPASAAIVAASGGFDESLAEIHARFATGDWTLLTDDLPIGVGGVFLMHAAGVPGSEREIPHDSGTHTSCAAIGDAIVYPFPEGTYHAEMLEHLQRPTSATPGAYAVMVRITRLGALRPPAG